MKIPFCWGFIIGSVIPARSKNIGKAESTGLGRSRFGIPSQGLVLTGLQDEAERLGRDDVEVLVLDDQDDASDIRRSKDQGVWADSRRIFGFLHLVQLGNLIHGAREFVGSGVMTSDVDQCVFYHVLKVRLRLGLGKHSFSFGRGSHYRPGLTREPLLRLIHLSTTNAISPFSCNNRSSVEVGSRTR